MEISESLTQYQELYQILYGHCLTPFSPEHSMRCRYCYYPRFVAGAAEGEKAESPEQVEIARPIDSRVGLKTLQVCAVQTRVASPSRS